MNIQALNRDFFEEPVGSETIASFPIECIASSISSAPRPIASPLVNSADVVGKEQCEKDQDTATNGN